MRASSTGLKSETAARPRGDREDERRYGMREPDRCIRENAERETAEQRPARTKTLRERPDRDELCCRADSARDREQRARRARAQGEHRGEIERERREEAREREDIQKAAQHHVRNAGQSRERTNVGKRGV